VYHLIKVGVMMSWRCNGRGGSTSPRLSCGSCYPLTVLRTHVKLFFGPFSRRGCDSSDEDTESAETKKNNRRAVESESRFPLSVYLLSPIT